MRRFARYPLQLLLVLALVVTGQALAQARGQAAAVGQMVICTGTGPVMVSVDTEGNPTGPPHICPEGALALFLDGAAPATGHAPVRALFGLARCSESPPSTAQAEIRPSARDPPRA